MSDAQRWCLKLTMTRRTILCESPYDHADPTLTSYSTDVDSHSFSSEVIPLAASISGDSLPRSPDQPLSTPIPLARSPSLKSEVISPIPRTPPRQRVRMVVKTYSDIESDDESEQSSYTPSPPVKRIGTRKNPKTSPSRVRKKTSPIRGGEPRRQQNMVAQKRYRDKKVQGAQRVSCFTLSF
jgi:hypothetical protein